MKVYGANEQEIRDIVKEVSEVKYGGNLIIKDSRDESNSAGPRATFTITVDDSKGPGARRSWSGRRIKAACWHAHYDVIIRLWERYGPPGPDGELRVLTSRYWKEEYKGNLTEVREQMLATTDINIGSVMEPAYMPDLCECERE